VKHAQKAFEKWGLEATPKTRAAVMIKAHQLLSEHATELTEIIMKEHGKNRPEAMAEIAKGLETLEYAMSLPQLVSGKIQEVSRGVYCQDRRDALGVVVSIVPFNFPCMVPMWTIPIALASGNCMILKPSEKVPVTMSRVIELFTVRQSINQSINHITDLSLTGSFFLLAESWSSCWSFPNCQWNKGCRRSSLRSPRR